MRVRFYVMVLLLGLAGLALLGWAAATGGPWPERRMLPDFRTPWPQLAARFAAVRGLAALSGAALLAGAAPLGRRWAAQRPWWRPLAMATPTLLAALAGICAAELILRVTVAPAQRARSVAHEPRRLPDGYLGWTNVAGRLSYAQVSGRRVLYVFDAAGLRVDRPGAQVDPARPTVLLAGESFMDGYGLDWGESIAGQLQALTGVQAADVAVEDYSVDQAFLRLRAQLGRFRRPVAVVTLFLPSTIYRTLDPTRPHLTPDLAWRPGGREWRLAHALRGALPLRSPHDVDRAVTVTRRALQETARLAQARGARPLVVIPVLAPEPAVEARLRRRVLDGAGTRYLVVPLAASELQPGNRHPNAAGARKLAASIAAALAAEAAPGGLDWAPPGQPDPSPTSGARTHRPRPRP